jgi:hypothetical protein
MRCDEVDNLVVDSLATGTEAWETAIAAHLSECERCRGQFASLLEVARSITRVPWCDLPAGFDDRFRQRLAQAESNAGLRALMPPVRFVVALGSRGLTWLLFLMLSSGLVLGIDRGLGSGPGSVIEITSSNLAGLLSIMLLGVLLPAAVPLLQILPRGSRS